MWPGQVIPADGFDFCCLYCYCLPPVLLPVCYLYCRLCCYLCATCTATCVLPVLLPVLLSVLLSVLLPVLLPVLPPVLPPVLLPVPAERFLIKLVDFDWSGRHGIDRYPYSMSQSIPWPGTADVGLPVLQEHDTQLMASTRQDGMLYRDWTQDTWDNPLLASPTQAQS
jgi:hypothetical protein